jgi:hypothetical protein
MEAAGGLLCESVALVQLPEQKATGIRCYPATLKIVDDFLGKKADKGAGYGRLCSKGIPPDKLIV